jgi:hypothetical protein
LVDGRHISQLACLSAVRGNLRTIKALQVKKTVVMAYPTRWPKVAGGVNGAGEERLPKGEE